jgi:hypothetical protein
MSCYPHLDVSAGDAWNHTFLYADLDSYDVNGDPIAGDPIPLTGMSARLDVRDEDGDLITTASTDNGLLTITAAAGQIDLAMPASDTALLAPTRRRELIAALRIWDTTDYDNSAKTIAIYTLVAVPSKVGGA